MTALASPSSTIGGYTWRSWWALIVLTILYIVSLLDRQIITLMFAEMRSDFGLSDFQIGLMHGLSFSIFYATFGLLFGWAADRYSRRWIIFIGVVIWSLATAACGLSRTVAQLFTARFLVGAGEAALNPAAYSLLSDSFSPKQRPLVFSIFGAGAVVGLAASLLVGGLLLSHLPSRLDFPLLGELAAWQAVFLIVGLPGSAVALLVWTLRDPPRQERLEQAKPAASEALGFARERWKFFAGHFIGFACLGGTANAVNAWLPTYLMRKFDLPIGDIVSLLAPASIIPGVAGTIIAGICVAKLSARGIIDIHLRFFIFTAALQLIVLALAATAGTLPLIIAAQCVFMFLACYTGVAVAALQITVPNQYRGQVSAAYLFAFNLIGLGMGPTLVGAFATYVVADDTKLGLSIALAAGVMLPIAIVAFTFALAPMRAVILDARKWMS